MTSSANKEESLIGEEQSMRASLKRKRIDSKEVITVQVKGKKHHARKRSDVVMIRGPASASKATESCNSPDADTHPEERLQLILKSNGYSCASLLYKSLEDFFLKTTPNHLVGYTSEVVKAVQQGDVEQLRAMHRSGKNLQCCNRFGESIVHMACRRGATAVLQFLMEEANVSIRIHDDYGRTPLHDACWTRDPEFGIVAMLIRVCPDLFLVKDKRGHTPLSYVRRNHWARWCDFLEKHKHLLHPKEVCASSPDR